MEIFSLDIQLRARGVINTGYIQVNIQCKNFFSLREKNTPDNKKDTLTESTINVQPITTLESLTLRFNFL